MLAWHLEFHLAKRGVNHAINKHHLEVNRLWHREHVHLEHLADLSFERWVFNFIRFSRRHVFSVDYEVCLHPQITDVGSPLAFCPPKSLIVVSPICGVNLGQTEMVDGFDRIIVFILTLYFVHLQHHRCGSVSLLRAYILYFHPRVVDFVRKIVKLTFFSLEFLVNLVKHL